MMIELAFNLRRWGSPSWRSGDRPRSSRLPM